MARLPTLESGLLLSAQLLVEQRKTLSVVGGRSRICGKNPSSSGATLYSEVDGALRRPAGSVGFHGGGTAQRGVGVAWHPGLDILKIGCYTGTRH